MARAVWKGPFVEESLMKKVDKYKDDPKKYLLKLGLENLQFFLILLELVFKFTMVKNLSLLQFQRIWLDINWENFHQQEHFMVIPQQIKKLNLQRKNKYE